MIDENKLTQIKQMIASAEEAIHSAKQMLSDAAGADFFEEGGDVTVKAKTVVFCSFMCVRNSCPGFHNERPVRRLC